MQYWIFPLIGFVGLTWNKSSNLWNQVYLKQNFSYLKSTISMKNSNIDKIYNTISNKESIDLESEMQNSFYSSFSFPIQAPCLKSSISNTLKTRIISIREESFYKSNFFEQNKLLLESEILKKNIFIKEKKFTSDFDLLNRNRNFQTSLSKNLWNSCEFSTIANSFLWSKMLKNNKPLNTSLTFNDKLFLYEKNPKKIFLFPSYLNSKSFAVVQTQKIKKEPFYSIINIPKSFVEIEDFQDLNQRFKSSISNRRFEINSLDLKKETNKELTNTSKNSKSFPRNQRFLGLNQRFKPIHSYEKGKFLLDNVTKIFEFHSKNLNINNIDSMHFLDKLRYKNYIINNLSFKSKLLDKFVFLKMDKKNIPFLDLESHLKSVLNHRLKTKGFQDFNQRFESSISNRFQIEDLKYWISIKDLNPGKFEIKKPLVLNKIEDFHSFKSNEMQNKNNQMILKKIPIQLKFDLDKFLFLKKFHSKMHYKISKFDNPYFRMGDSKTSLISNRFDLKSKILNQILEKSKIFQGRFEILDLNQRFKSWKFEINDFRDLKSLISNHQIEDLHEKSEIFQAFDFLDFQSKIGNQGNQIKQRSDFKNLNVLIKRFKTMRETDLLNKIDNQNIKNFIFEMSILNYWKNSLNLYEKNINYPFQRFDNDFFYIRKNKKIQDLGNLLNKKNDAIIKKQILLSNNHLFEKKRFLTKLLTIKKQIKKLNKTEKIEIPNFTSPIPIRLNSPIISSGSPIEPCKNKQSFSLKNSQGPVKNWLSDKKIKGSWIILDQRFKIKEIKSTNECLNNFKMKSFWDMKPIQSSFFYKSFINSKENHSKLNFYLKISNRRFEILDLNQRFKSWSKISKENEKTVKKNSMTFILHLKELWFINLSSFINQFHSFLSNLLNLLYFEIFRFYLKPLVLNHRFKCLISDRRSEILDLNQRFKSWKSKISNSNTGISDSSKQLGLNPRFEILDLNQKFKSWNSKINDVNFLKIKLIKRKKSFKNLSIKIQSSKKNLKKNTKEKIFRTLLSYKSYLISDRRSEILDLNQRFKSWKQNLKFEINDLHEKSEIFQANQIKQGGKDSQKYMKPIQWKNSFVRLKKRMKKLRFINFKSRICMKNQRFFKQIKSNKDQKFQIIENSKKLKISKISNQRFEMLDLNQRFKSWNWNSEKSKELDSKGKSQMKKKSSLNHLFRRIGFIFLFKSKDPLDFLESNKQENRNNYKFSILKRFENEKSFQKKRRRKKLKLETRRRKKRKRFYPRPIWLRYSLYTKFLTKRHFYKDSSFFKFDILNGKSSISVKNPRFFKSNKGQRFKSNQIKQRSADFLKCNKDNQFSMFKSFIKSQKLKNKIYRNNKKKWGNFIQDTPTFEKIALKKFRFFSYLPIYQNKEYYKVSNGILAEFQPLCWKSYWLRSNLSPYMNRIQNHFNQMKDVEKNTNFSKINSFLLKILGFFSYDYSYNMLEILPFYSNFKNSFDSQHEFYISNLSHFEKTNKISEYNRIEFERLSEILKNVKFNMNLEGQNKPKSYKFMAWKYLISLREFKNQNKKNFWNRLAYNIEPNLSFGSAFRILSNISSNPNSSLKPYKSNPTLRVLWSFNKTNQFTFKEKNQIRDLWEICKLRDQLKSNQTKKFLINLLKLKNDFYFKKIFSQRETDSIGCLISDRRSEILDLNKRFKSWKSKIFQGRRKFRKLTKMNSATIKKFQRIQKKFVLLGSDLKSVKASKFWKSKKLNILNQRSKIKQLDTYPFWDSKPRLLKPSSFFWWSTKNYSTSFNLNAFNSFDSIYKKSYLKDLLESKIKKRNNWIFLEKSSIFQSCLISDPRSEILDLNQRFKSWKSKISNNQIKDLKESIICMKNQRFFKHLLISNILIFSILFHLSILFSFTRIPELRSLLKFQLLLFYKISNNYFIVLYSIYNLLQKYKEQMFIVYKNFYTKSSNILKSNQKFDYLKSNKEIKDFKKFKESIDLCLLESPIPGIIDSSKNQRFFKYLNLRFKSSKHLISNQRFKSWNQRFKNQVFDISNNQISDLHEKSKIFQAFDFESKISILNQQILEWNLNFPKIINKDWKWYGLLFENKDLLDLKSLISNTRGSLLNSFVQKTFSETPFIYSFSYNFLQSFYSNKLLNLSLLYKIHIKENSLRKNSLKIDGLEFNFKRIYFKNLYNQGLSFINIQTQFALFFLFLSYQSVRFSSFLFESSYQFLLKIIDLFESFLLILYKFLEKPAELMVEWIAQTFLIEWSSDVSTFIPETFDMYFWNSFQRFFRHSRVLGFVEFQSSINVYNFMNTFPFSRFYGNAMSTFSYELNMEKKMPFLSSFGIANLAGFFIQRRLWHFFHLFIDSILKPDIDLMTRQKKGKIFWDIWAEILIRAAEQYNINIPSLTSLKEEQEKLIERLIQDPAFVSFYQNLENNEPFISLDFKFHDLKSKISNHQIFDLHEKSKIFQAFDFESKIRNQIKQEQEQVQIKTRSKVLKFDILNQRFQRINDFKQRQTLLNKDLNNLSVSNIFKNSYKTKNWSSNQYIPFNLKDTDLFLDISPPKSFLSVNFIANYAPIQYTLGSIMCEIYSGLFPMKVSKNLLIINSQVSNFSSSSFHSKDSSKGSYGSLIIQALAGESEMKIMIDNANRYALIQRGIAVGMKLLRDVFESIVLQTPCFFLIEDIHVIGERRSMLISDDENSKAAISVFGFEQDEESEKNQMIYQSSRHSMNDYRRPYKGDFSMLIPTNLYNKDLYSFKKFKTNLKLNQQKKSPISFPSVENFLNEQPYNSDKHSNLNQEKSKSKLGSFNVSSLQMSSESLFAPPSTSPFTILMMKEQKKLKPKKIVKQTLWNSFVVENIISSRPDSIRAKVAILADVTLRNFSVKLDMITDLLVIIDNVRSNRGFVVFATTHLPSILDPALRRPGRFDETISFPLIPNLMNRWSLFQMHFVSNSFENGTGFQKKSSKETFDKFEYGNLTENFHFTKINNLISKTKLSILKNYNYPMISNRRFEIKKSSISKNLESPISELKSLVSNEAFDFQSLIKNPIKQRSWNQRFQHLNPRFKSKDLKISKENNRMLALLLRSKKVESFIFKKIIHPSQAFQSFFIDPNFNSFLSPLFDSSKLEIKDFHDLKSKISNHQIEDLHEKSEIFQAFDFQSKIENQIKQGSVDFKIESKAIDRSNPNLYKNSKKVYSQISFGYFQIGNILIISDLLKDQTAFSLYNKSLILDQSSPFVYHTLYSSLNSFKMFLMRFLGGKIAEFLITKNPRKILESKNKNNSYYSSLFGILNQRFKIMGDFKQPIDSPLKSSISNLKFEINDFHDLKSKISNHQISDLHEKSEIFQAFDFQSKIENQIKQRKETNKNFKFQIKNGNFSTMDQQVRYNSWHFATSWVFAILQKRFLYHKNLIITKMLSFDNPNQSSLREPPSPPASSLLMPSKKYENLKRVERDFQQKSVFSINEKIQMHQKQRFLKKLYNKPVLDSFRSQLFENRITSFDSSFKEFSYNKESMFLKSSSSRFYYKNRLNIRHRFSLINQWWNGQLAEHNVEVTYLSDIDWRTMYIQSNFKSKDLKEWKSSISTEFKFETNDFKQRVDNNRTNLNQIGNQKIDVVLDFPDADQHYNPRVRRWFLNANSWNYWLSFETNFYYEIYFHMIYDSFNKTSIYFNENRELLDFFVSTYLQKGSLKELDFIFIFSRFYR